MNDLNLTASSRCLRGKSTSGDSLDEETSEYTDADQVVTDLSILEYQLINSVSQRKDPLQIRQDTKDQIISDLDQYFDKSSALDEQVKSESQEQPVEHKPYINNYNRSSESTKITIDGLKEAQMYMFQVFACHNTSYLSLSEACSLNGIILAVRTRPGDRAYSIVFFEQTTVIVVSHSF